MTAACADGGVAEKPVVSNSRGALAEARRKYDKAMVLWDDSRFKAPRAAVNPFSAALAKSPDFSAAYPQRGAAYAGMNKLAVAAPARCEFPPVPYLSLQQPGLAGLWSYG